MISRLTKHRRGGGREGGAVVNKGKQRLSVLLLVTFVAEGHRGFSRGLKSSVMDGATGLLKVTHAQIASGC